MAMLMRKSLAGSAVAKRSTVAAKASSRPLWCVL
jgi:hypothetical protein